VSSWSSSIFGTSWYGGGGGGSGDGGKVVGSRCASNAVGIRSKDVFGSGGGTASNVIGTGSS
jgi:hypothetical protein